MQKIHDIKSNTFIWSLGLHQNKKYLQATGIATSKKHNLIYNWVSKLGLYKERKNKSYLES